MGDWLKLIGNHDRECPMDYAFTHDYVHFRKRRPRSIRPGDRMVLYAVGGSKRVFALAEVTSEVKCSGQADWPFQVDIEYSVRLLVPSGVLITELDVPGGRNLLDAIRRRSYLRLTPQEYARAESKLIEAARKV